MADHAQLNSSLPEPFLRVKGELYFHRALIPGADPSSFTVLLKPKPDIFNYYAKDDKRAYFFNSYGAKPKIKIIRCKDVHSFERLDYYHAKDSQHVYFKGTKMKGADPYSFVHVGLGYWKDKNHVYHGKLLLKEADPASFIFIGGNHYATDRENLYWYGRLSNESKTNELETDVQDFIKSHMHLKGYWWTSHAG